MNNKERKKCVFYGGKRRSKIICLTDQCICKHSVERVRWERRKNANSTN